MVRLAAYNDAIQNICCNPCARTVVINTLVEAHGCPNSPHQSGLG